jgi:hypothetical protein
METFVTQVQFNGMSAGHDQPENVEKSIKELVEQEDGRLLDLYPILGSRGTDLIVVCSFPNSSAALKAWFGLGTKYNWRTQTNPSISKEQFQQVYQQIHATTTSVSRTSPGAGARS